MSKEEITRSETASLMERILYEVKKVIVGQDHFLERVMVALLAQGHLLVEGVPGLAKTLTVKTLARSIHGSFKRIQFTPDLVPADLVGTRIYNQKTGEFTTSLGPVFANLLLADEINRAPAKVQSALLEVMQERQVTIAGETHRVPDPFLVMATQNPIETEGVYPLPEAQVDRFMMKVLVGYPTEEEEFVIVDRVTGIPNEVATDCDHRAIERAAARVPRPLCGSVAQTIRGAACLGDAGSGALRRFRYPIVYILRRKPPRLDQSHRGRPRTGVSARPHLRVARGRHRSRSRCISPPRRAGLRGAGRGNDIRPTDPSDHEANTAARQAARDPHQNRVTECMEHLDLKL